MRGAEEWTGAGAGGGGGGRGSGERGAGRGGGLRGGWPRAAGPPGNLSRVPAPTSAARAAGVQGEGLSQPPAAGLPGPPAPPFPQGGAPGARVCSGSGMSVRTWPQACTGKPPPRDPNAVSAQWTWSSPNDRTETLGNPTVPAHQPLGQAQGTPNIPMQVPRPPSRVLGPKKSQLLSHQQMALALKQIVPAGSGQDTRTPSCGWRVCKMLALDNSQPHPSPLPEPSVVCTPVTMGPRWERTGHTLRAGETSGLHLSLPPRNSVCLRQPLPPGLGVCVGPSRAAVSWRQSKTPEG